jgi:type IV secretory pathway VirB4 component
MIKDGRIWVANNDNGEPISINPKLANRHGLVAGATGTGKTVTLKVMAAT